MSQSPHVIIRRLEWDSMHRIPNHEGKCAAYHGHRYVAEIAVQSYELDQIGRVVDFSVIKTLIGAWVDAHWDHTAIIYEGDPDAAVPLIVASNLAHGRPVYRLPEHPTVENIAAELGRICKELLEPEGVALAWIRLWETPNCSALWTNAQ